MQPMGVCQLPVHRVQQKILHVTDDLLGKYCETKLSSSGSVDGLDPVKKKYIEKR